MDVRVGIFVDYKSQYAKGVAEAVWTGLTRAASKSGGGKVSTYWDGLSRKDVVAIMASKAPPMRRKWDVSVFVVGQDRPDVIDEIIPLKDDEGSAGLCGLVVATPQNASPLSGPLLYQGVERLGERGVKTGNIEPALLRDFPDECEAYAGRILQRVSGS